MKYSDVKDAVNMWGREVVERMLDGEEDFEVDNQRFITPSVARQDVYNRYEDPYMVGCFNPDFIADFIDLDYDDIQDLQRSDKLEIIGRMVHRSGKYEDMMDEYIRMDGWGHALSSYDGNYEEVVFNHTHYITFRV